MKLVDRKMNGSNREIRAKSLYFEGPGRVAIRDTSVVAPRRGQVLVKTLFSAISSGTESLIYRGEWPSELVVDKSIPTLSGKFRYPLKYGYAAVGRVIEVGEGLTPEWIGRLVFAFNPHETHFVSSTKKLILVPENVTPEGACFLPNMETALSLVLDGSPLIGEVVAVFGQGVVGLLTTALLARMSVGKVVTFDKHLMRRRASLLLGADLSIDSTTDFGPGRFEDFFDDVWTDDDRADLTYELSGRPEVLNQAISITGFDGRIVLGSFYGSKKAPIELGGWFHRSRIKIISSQVSSIAPHLAGRWSKTRMTGFVLKMLGQLEPDRLVTHRINFSEAERAYKLLDETPDKVIQVILKYEETP